MKTYLVIIVVSFCFIHTCAALSDLGIKDLLTVAHGQRITDKSGKIENVPYFIQKLPIEVRDIILGKMLKNALDTLPDWQLAKRCHELDGAKEFAWNPQGTTLAQITHHENIYLYSTPQSMKLSHRAFAKRNNPPLHFDRTGTLLVARDGSDLPVYVTNIENDNRFFQQAEDAQLYFSPSQDLVIAFQTRVGQGYLSVFDTRTKKIKKTHRHSLNVYTRPQTLAWHPTKAYALIAALSDIHLFNIETGHINALNIPKNQQSSYDAIAYSPEGNRIIVSDGKVAKWHTIDDEFRFQENGNELHCGETETIKNIQWSCDGKYIAFGINVGSNSFISIRDCNNEYIIHCITSACFAWHPKNEYFAIPGHIYTWQAKNRLGDYFFSAKHAKTVTLEQKLLALVLLASKRTDKPLSVTRLISKNSKFLKREEVEEIFYSFPADVRWYLQHVFDLRFKKNWYEYIGDIIA